MLPFTVLIGSVILGHAFCITSLNYYETFSDITVVSRVKKSSGVSQLMKQVQFHVLNLSFHLTLTSGATVLAKGFTSYLINGYGEMTPFNFDTNTIFTGHKTGNTSVFVSAHTEQDLWTLHIFEDNNTYVVEPAWSHLNAARNPKNDTYIAYRASDFKNVTWKCNAKHYEQNRTSVEDKYSRTDFFTNTSHSSERNKRYSNGAKACLMNIFGDYDLFSKRCRHNKEICGSLLISIVQKADIIYRSSVFPFINNINFRNIGLYVKTLVLYDSYTIALNPYKERYIHFNVDGKDWTADDKLDSFSYFMKFFRPKLCLSHLITAFPFPFSVLGLAFTDTLCKAGYDEKDVINTAVTSTLNTRNEPVSSLEMLIAFAHEVGHNFGSPHDPESPECFPLDSEGGTYIMWSVGSSGKHPNNFRFSPCSLKEIGIRLAKTDCLTENFYQSLCGNGLIEENEQCDPGLDGRDIDPCCTKDCYLRIGAVCSDKFHKCCSDCQMASSSTVCAEEEPWSCKQKSYCLGNSLHCPEPKPLPNFTKCLDGGQCYNGVCVSYCEAKGVKEKVNLKSCLCRTPDNACKWCCFNNSAPEHLKDCKPHSRGSVSNGRRCYMGTCQTGVCQPVIISRFNQVYSYITSVPRLGVARVVKNNLVMITLTISSCIWVFLMVLSQRIIQAYEMKVSDIPVVKVCPPVQMSEVVKLMESTMVLVEKVDSPQSATELPFITPPETNEDYMTAQDATQSLAEGSRASIIY